MFEGRKVISLLSVLALSCWVSVCFAEDTRDGNGKQGYVEAELEEIVVTATMTEKPAAEVPQAVTYISRDEIDTTGSLSTTDTFQRLPGVAVFDYGSNGFGNQIYVRGFDFARTQNNLDFQIDGVTIHSQGDFGNPILNAIPRAAIDHVEFSRGTEASLYGQQASIGVIDSFVKRAFGPWTAEVTGGYGSYAQGYGGVGVTGSYGNFGCTLAMDYAHGGTYADEQSYRNRSFIFAPTVKINSKTTIETTVLMGDRLIDNPSITPLTPAQLSQDRQQNFDRGELKSPVTFVGLGAAIPAGGAREGVFDVELPRNGIESGKYTKE